MKGRVLQEVVKMDCFDWMLQAQAESLNVGLEIN